MVRLTEGGKGDPRSHTQMLQLRGWEIKRERERERDR